MDQLSLRGLDKVLGSAFRFALTYNILRLISRSYAAELGHPRKQLPDRFLLRT